MEDVTTSCTFDKEVLSELKEYLRQPMPIGGFVIGNVQGNGLNLISSIIPYQSLMMTPQGATYFQIEGNEIVHIRNVLNAVRAYFPNSKINRICGFLISKPKQSLELTNKDLTMFRTWGAFDKRLVAVLVDSYIEQNGVRVFNSDFKEVKINEENIRYDENDKKAYNFFNWQVNIYYKSKNLQAPAVIIPKRIMDEIKASQASIEQQRERASVESGTIVKTYEKQGGYDRQQLRKEEREGYEVPGTTGPMVFENYFPEGSLDSGKDKEEAKTKEKKEKKEEDKPLYERKLREW